MTNLATIPSGYRTHYRRKICWFYFGDIRVIWNK